VKNYSSIKHAPARDLHYRNTEETAGNGGFLFKWRPLYLDMGHIEYGVA